MFFGKDKRKSNIYAIKGKSKKLQGILSLVCFIIEDCLNCLDCSLHV